jgi:hypothetical protein
MEKEYYHSMDYASAAKDSYSNNYVECNCNPFWGSLLARGLGRSWGWTRRPPLSVRVTCCYLNQVQNGHCRSDDDIEDKSDQPNQCVLLTILMFVVVFKEKDRRHQSSDLNPYASNDACYQPYNSKPKSICFLFVCQRRNSNNDSDNGDKND